MNSVFGLYIFCSFYMTGVIWLIQLIHYPSFKDIGADEFVAFHRRHSKAMSILVGPIMIAELVTSLILASQFKTFFEIFWLIQVAMTAALWFLTFLVSVPIHKRLEQSKQDPLLRQLVKTNWPRTVLWTAKAALLFTLSRDSLVGLLGL